MKNLKLLKRRYIVYSAIVLLIAFFALGGNINVNVDNPLNSENRGIGNFVTVTIGTEQAYAAGTPDYTCDGVDDDVQFQAAINALPATGGELEVLGGTYVFANLTSVTRAIANVTITGVGLGTSFTGDGVTPTWICGGNNWKFQDLQVDAGSITVGATTGWQMINVQDNATLYAYRDPFTNIVGNTLDPTQVEAFTLIGKLTAAATEIEGNNFDINGGDVFAINISGGLTWAAAQNLASQILTNINIDSGNIDGATIATSNITISGGNSLTTTAGTLTSGPTQDVGESKERSYAFVFANNATVAPSANDTANRIWVCDGTDDQIQIKAAYDALVAGNGGTIFFSDGTFQFDDHVSVSTNSGKEIRFKGCGATLFSFDYNDMTFDGMFANQYQSAPDLFYDVSNITFDNIKFYDDQGTGGPSYAILLGGWNDGESTLGNMQVLNCEFDHTAAWISNSNSGRNLYYNNYVHDIADGITSDSALSFRHCDSGAEFLANVVHTTPNMGLYALNSIGVNFQFNRVTDTGLVTASGSGIDSNSCDQVNVSQNLIFCKQGIFSEDDSGEVNISYNIIVTSTQTRWGIQIWDNANNVGVDNAICNYNIIQGPNRGIEFQDVINGLIQGNIIIGTNQYAIELAQTLGNPRLIRVLENEIFDHCQGSPWNAAIFANLDNVRIERNYIDGDSNANVRGITGNGGVQDDTYIRDNTIVNCPASIYDSLGSGVTGKTIIFQFTGGDNDAGGRNLDWGGYLIDSGAPAAEVARVFFHLPDDCSYVQSIEIWAQSDITEADGMMLDIGFYAGQENELNNTHQILVPNAISDTTNFAQYDVIRWEIDSGDDADVASITAGDHFYGVVTYHAAAAPNINTDAWFQSIQINYLDNLT